MFDDIERILVGETELHDMMREHMTWITKCMADGEHKPKKVKCSKCGKLFTPKVPT
jgi:hypothetical protein